MPLHIPTVIPEAIHFLQMLQDSESATDRGGGSGEGLRQNRSLGLKRFPVECRADLGDLSKCHNICESIQTEMLECEGATQTREGLYFIEDYQDVVVAADLAKRFEVLMRTGIVASFASH